MGFERWTRGALVDCIGEVLIDAEVVAAEEGPEGLFVVTNCFRLRSGVRVATVVKPSVDIFFEITGRLGAA